MRAVSLFSGCLGLDLGLERVGVETVCFVENDPHCLRLIRDRRPGGIVVEDVHDVDRKIEETLGTIDLVAGGFPCQDMSYAGRGAGFAGDRSVLWFEMERVVEELRPRLVLVENVPGLLTRGLGVVLFGLARLGYVGHWFTLGAADVGAPHRRERVLVVARRADGRGDVLSGGHPAGLLDLDSGWLPPQETLFDRAPLTRLGKRGRWTLGAVYEDDPRLAIDDDSEVTLLPTPNAYESTPTEKYAEEMRAVGVDPEARLYLPGRKHHVQRTLSRVVPLMEQVGEERQDGERLMPTPSAWLGRRPENAMADPERAASRQHEGTRGKRSVELPDALAAEVEVKLLPTPQVADGDRSSEQGPRHYVEGSDNPTLLGAARRVSGDRLLPTPQATDGSGGRLTKDPETLRTGIRPSGSHMSVPLATALYRDGVSDSVADPTIEVQWGVYEPAIRRWEQILGRPAPKPTDEKGRLSPEFVTWMLGLPVGWTDVEEVSRTAQLRMLGNSVQAQVAVEVGETSPHARSGAL